MKKTIIALFFTLLSIALYAMDFPEHAFGYQSTALYPEIIQKLGSDPHPWAKRFLDNMQVTERQNRTDLERLLEANNAQILPCDEALFKDRITETLLRDEKKSAELLQSLTTQGFKMEDHWVLFTGLKKMIGIDGQPGIYKDSVTFMENNPWVYDGQADRIVKLYGNQVTVAKNTLIHALAEAGGDPALIKELDIIHPTKISQVVMTQAKGLMLYDEDKYILYKPSASYEFGANPSEINKNIWDCSSFIALVIESDFRFSTMDFEEAYKAHHSLSPANERTESILRQMQIIELPAKLEFMDVLVWRGHKGGGHMAFYLGEKDDGTIIIGEANRSDDKSTEGTGITQSTLQRDGKTTYVFRRRDARY